jgi:hypothetical protein
MKARRFVLLGNLLLGGLLMLVVWALLTWVASRPALKRLIDLTPQQINTVDPATEELLRELRGQQAEIEFHLFAPSALGEPENDMQRQAFAIRARLAELSRMLLKRYQYLGGEAVVVHDHDFDRESPELREAAQRFEYKSQDNEVLVISVRMPGKEPRHRKLSLISDLAVIELPNTGGGPTARAALPVLKDFQGEKAISSALKSLLVQGVPIAYVLRDYSSIVDLTGATPSSYSGFVAALQRAGFEVRPMTLRSSEGQVPADASLVIVLEPDQEFSERDADALFGYLQRGGRLFVNYCWSALADRNPTGGRLGELLGYELSRAPVYHLIPSGRTGGPGLDGNDAVARLQMRVNRTHPTTRRIAENTRPLEVAAARFLKERDGAPVAVRREPLLQTGDQAWLAVIGPDGLPDNRAPNIQRRAYEVAMAFEVPPPAAAPSPATDTARAGQAVIVSGLFANNAGMMAGFGDFAVNVCNWMAERRVLLDIASSGYKANYMQLQPQQIGRVWWFLVAGVPGAFALLGLVVFFVRRRQ